MYIVTGEISNNNRIDSSNNKIRERSGCRIRNLAINITDGFLYSETSAKKLGAGGSSNLSQWITERDTQ